MKKGNLPPFEYQLTQDIQILKLKQDMFVAVSCDLASNDHRDAVYQIFSQYGLKQIMTNLFESTSISEKVLSRLKRDIDRITDSYDGFRFYQYPVEDTLVITSLKEKKWRKLTIRV